MDADLAVERAYRRDVLTARRAQSSPDPQFISALHLRTIAQVAKVHQSFAFIPAAISSPVPVRTGGEIQKWIRPSATHRP